MPFWGQRIAFTLEVRLDFLGFSFLDFFFAKVVFVVFLHLEVGELQCHAAVFHQNVMIEIRRATGRIADIHPTLAE